MEASMTEELPTVEQPPQGRKLTLADRCDECGSAAYGIVITPKGELYFCGHHFHTYEPMFAAKGYETHDETDAILAEDKAIYI